MRALGVDHGDRRVGIAISDESKTLARPLTTLRGGTKAELLARLLTLIDQLVRDDGSLDLVVVGLPRRLDGTPNERTAVVNAFVEALKASIALPVVTEDERLSSREAESRLALFRKGWRDRKALVDSAAAAVILQDYLDRQRPAAIDADAFEADS